LLQDTLHLRVVLTLLFGVSAPALHEFTTTRPALWRFATALRHTRAQHKYVFLHHWIASAL